MRLEIDACSADISSSDVGDTRPLPLARSSGSPPLHHQNAPRTVPTRPDGRRNCSSIHLFHPLLCFIGKATRDDGQRRILECTNWPSFNVMVTAAPLLVQSVPLLLLDPRLRERCRFVVSLHLPLCPPLLSSPAPPSAPVPDVCFCAGRTLSN